LLCFVCPDCSEGVETPNASCRRCSAPNGIVGTTLDSKINKRSPTTKGEIDTVRYSFTMTTALAAAPQSHGDTSSQQGSRNETRRNRTLLQNLCHESSSGRYGTAVESVPNEQSPQDRLEISSRHVLHLIQNILSTPVRLYRGENIIDCRFVAPDPFNALDCPSCTFEFNSSHVGVEHR
jgi:hypothetical protein